MNQITPDILKRIVPEMPRAKRELYAPLIQEACLEFDITNEARVAAFLAQLAHESDHFNTLSEYASGAAYDNRRDLGNTKREAIEAARKANTTPGRFYKGHGAIQTTGYSNHKRVGEYLGIDAVNNPKLLATPEYAFRAAGFFWQDNNLNKWADRKEIRAVSGIVNAGSPNAKKINGLADRVRYYERALASLPDDFKLVPEPPEYDHDAEPDITREEAERSDAKTDTETDKGLTTSTKSPDEVEGTPPPAEAAEIKASQPSWQSRLTNFSLPAGVVTAITTIWTFAKGIPPWGWGLLGGIFIVSLVVWAWLHNESQKRAQQRTAIVMDAAANKDKNNLRLV